MALTPEQTVTQTQTATPAAPQTPAPHKGRDTAPTGIIGLDGKLVSTERAPATDIPATPYHVPTAAEEKQAADQQKAAEAHTKEVMDKYQANYAASMAEHDKEVAAIHAKNAELEKQRAAGLEEENARKAYAATLKADKHLKGADRSAADQKAYTAYSETVARDEQVLHPAPTPQAQTPAATPQPAQSHADKLGLTGVNFNSTGRTAGASDGQTKVVAPVAGVQQR